MASAASDLRLFQRRLRHRAKVVWCPGCVVRVNLLTSIFTPCVGVSRQASMCAFSHLDAANLSEFVNQRYEMSPEFGG